MNCGKVKNYIKEETVKRITNLLNKYSREDLKTTREFQSLTKHYINGYEREHLEQIISLCHEGRTYDEIRFIISKGEKTTMSKKNSKKPENVNDDIIHNNEDMDPVEEEAVFMISQQKVVEIDKPVEVIIGSDNVDESNDETTQNEATGPDEETDVDVESEIETDSNDVVIIGDIINNRRNTDTIINTDNNTNNPKKINNKNDHFNFIGDHFRKMHEDIEKACQQTHEDNERILRESRTNAG